MDANALYLAYHGDALDAALRLPAVASGAPPDGVPAMGNLEVDLGALARLDRSAAPDLAHPQPGELYARFSLHLRPEDANRVSVEAHLLRSAP